jgi:hypothetical protein
MLSPHIDQTAAISISNSIFAIFMKLAKFDYESLAAKVVRISLLSKL